MSFSILSAIARDTHRVRVTLSDAPQAISSTIAGDALNPTTWTVKRLDTGFSFTVAKVGEVSTTIFDIYVFEPLGPISVTHRVSSDTILSPVETNMELDAELPIEFDPPPAPVSISMDFFGLAESPPVTPTAAGTSDVLNAPTPTQDQTGGAYRVVSGDYQLQSGADLYRKLVLRRLLTKPGAFYHLPDYGMGLDPKTPVPLGSISRLKVEIERQVALEPETLSVSASVNVTASGIATYLINCKIKGQTGTVAVPIPNEVDL